MLICGLCATVMSHLTEVVMLRSLCYCYVTLDSSCLSGHRAIVMLPLTKDVEGWSLHYCCVTLDRGC